MKRTFVVAVAFALFSLAAFAAHKVQGWGNAKDADQDVAREAATKAAWDDAAASCPSDHTLGGARIISSNCTKGEDDDVYSCSVAVENECEEKPRW
jgi:hypothetical protein